MNARILLLFISILIFSCQQNEGPYVCPPCNLSCDTLSYKDSGSCPNCKMKLVLKSELEADLDLVVNQLDMREGSGKFLVEGGHDKSKTIIIHYHKPKNFSKKSQLVFVLPGAGRNGREYRDAWVEASETYGVVVITPEYSEKNYPEFWSYNLANMIYDVDVKKQSFKINSNSEQWLFGDFDRIFSKVQKHLDLETEHYDMFGHSAGGQLLHRFALFYPVNKANRILASNSGWYTVPSVSEDFPYGLGNLHTSVNPEIFNNQLVLFLGEEDNQNETRGQLRRSPEVDKQGLHRLERGTYFFNESKKIAENSHFDFNWKLEVIPNVGHDYKEMSKKASQYLYDTK